MLNAAGRFSARTGLADRRTKVSRFLLTTIFRKCLMPPIYHTPAVLTRQRYGWSHLSKPCSVQFISLTLLLAGGGWTKPLMPVMWVTA